MLPILTIAYSLILHPPDRRLITARFFAKSGLFLFMVFLTSLSNTAVFAQQPITPPKILFTEIFYNTPTIDANEEWVELTNFSSEPIDLSNYKLGDEEESGGGEGMLRFPPGSIIQPEQTIIIAQTAQDFFKMYGKYPDYEVTDSDPNVPDMRRFALWSTGQFALANDGDELLLLDDRSRFVDTLNYGDKTTYFDPPVIGVNTGQSIERLPASCDTDSAADWQPSHSPNPGVINMQGECRADILDTILTDAPLRIGQIQGDGGTSPFINQQVVVEGIVTGFLEDRNSSGTVFYTLFLQDLPGKEDGDPLTSDGIAVFLGRSQPANQLGDLIQISGTVTEFYGLTEIDDNDLEISTLSTGHLLPDPKILDLSLDPVGQREYLESHEGMLIAMAEPARVVGPTHSGCGFAVVDGRTKESPLPRQSEEHQVMQPMLIINNSDVDCSMLPDLKTGDQLSALFGPLTYHFDQYKIIPQNPDQLEIIAAPTRSLPMPVQPTEDQFTVASFNLHDHFDGIKDTHSSAEPIINDADLAVKQQKLAASLSRSMGCPTIVGVQEIENARLLQLLAAETAQSCGFTYEASHRESVDGRGIDQAFLTDPRRVQIDNISLQQTCSTLDTGLADLGITCPPSEEPLFSRPPLLVKLRVDGRPYTIINNHFKSKRGGEDETAVRRLLQAQHIAHLVSTQQADNPQSSIIVLGDFNDFEKSPTLLAMTEEAGLYNALASIPEADRYSYIFDGIPQLIDGILVSESLIPDIAGAQIVHTNADFPISLAADASTGAVQFHASDHDMPIVLFNLPKESSPATQTPQLENTPTLPTPTPQPQNIPTIPAPSPTAETTVSDQSSPPDFPLWPVILIILAVFTLPLIYLLRKK